MLYSFDWQYPQADRPKVNGVELTDAQLPVYGWMVVEDEPAALDWHTVGWERYKGWVQTPKPPQPYPSWVRNAKQTAWEAPVPRPNDGKFYFWDEEQQNWIEVIE